MTWAKRSFCGAVMSVARRSREAEGSRARSSATLSVANSGKGQWGSTTAPGSSVTSMRGLRPPSRSLSIGTLEVAGTLTPLVSSRAARAKTCSCLEVCAGESWQRAHLVSTPRKAVVMTVALAASGTSFCEATPNPAGPPSLALPPRLSSSVTIRSSGLRSWSDSRIHQRNGPVLFRVGLRMLGFSARTSCQ